MAGNYEVLKAAIADVIKTNGNNEITGALLQQTLLAMIASLGAGYHYVAIADPSTNPGTPDQNVFYLAATAGVYSNFGGYTLVAGELAILKWNGIWVKDTTGIATQQSVVDLSEAVAHLEQDIDDQQQEIEDFEQTIQNQINNFQPIIINGDVTNAPDEEDITTDSNNLLKFANRGTLNGKGYVILRRDKTFAQQVTLTNTIYEIRYDFTLTANFTMPENCVLFFNGGKISGAYSITGKRTLVAGRLVDIFDGVSLVGTIINESCNLCWWGAKSTDDSSGFDNSAIINTALNTTIRRIYVSKKYGISSPVNIAKNAHEIIGDSIRNYKQCGFVANSDFSGESITLPRDGVTYNVTGMFYHSYDQVVYLSGLCFDANKKAGYCIEHLAGYSAPFLDGVYLENALDANIVQYGCENPIFKDVRSVNARIGIYIGAHTVNIDKPYSYGSRMGGANIINLENVSCSACNYGLVLEGCSNASLKTCNTSWNSICGLLTVGVSEASIYDFYTEGDGLCRFYIDSSGIKHTNPSGDAYASAELVSNNLDGYKTIDSSNPFKEILYLRAPIWLFQSNVVINGLYTSIIPRAYSTTNVTAIEQPTERNANGVDSIVICSAGLVKINGHSVFLSSSNSPSNVMPKYTYVAASVNAYGAIGRFEIAGISLNSPSSIPVIFYANNTDWDSTMALNRYILSRIRFAESVGLNQMGGKKYGPISARFDWRRYGFRDVYKGVPLYQYTSDGALYMRLTKAEITEKFGNAKQVVMRLVSKVLTTGSYRIQADARLLDSSYNYVATAGVSSAGTVVTTAGYHEVFTRVNLEYEAAEWTYMQISLNVSDRDNVFTSEPLFYNNGDPITPPSYPSFVLESGTTSERPLLPNKGQKYFDETLGKEIVYNGTTWVNMDGSSLS